MKKKQAFIFCMVLVFSMLATVGCNKNRLDSYWINSEIIVDGDDTDWEGYGKIFDKKSGMSFGIANDEKNLMILVKGRNSDKRPAMHTSFWLNDNGKNKKEIGITYPAGRMGMMDRPGGMNFQKDQNPGNWQMGPEAMNNFEPENQEIQIRIGEDGYEFNIPPDGSEGILVVQNKNRNVTTTEICIPLSFLPDEEFSFNVEPGNVICIGIEVPSQENGGPGGMRGPGGGGPGGGGPGGGMGSGGMMPGGGGGGNMPPGGGNGAPPGGGRGGAPGKGGNMSMEVEWIYLCLAQDPHSLQNSGN